jgi:hypothetical protein
VSLDDPLEIERMTVLIVGDCVVAEDDELWQSKEFSQLDLGPDSDSQTDFLIPWFDPPLISPQPTVCAVPVSVTALDYAFGVSFGSAKRTRSGCGSNISSSSSNSDGDGNGNNTGGNSTSSGNGKGIGRGIGSGSGSSNNSSSSSGPVHSYLIGSTPLCGSSFSVLLFSAPDVPQTPCGSCCIKVPDVVSPAGRCPSVCPTFGPHDYCTLREFLLSDYRVNKRSGVNQNTAKEKDHASVHRSEPPRPLNTLTHQKDFLPRIVAEFFSLNFLWNFIMKVGCFDSQLFVELRWVVLRAILQLTSAASARAVLVPTRKVAEHKEGVESEVGMVRIYPQSQPETVTETVTVSEVLKVVRKWCDAAVACFRCHSCCSIAAVLQIRSRISHWLLALCSRLRKEVVQSHDHLQAAVSTSSSENGLLRSHFNDDLIHGSVYALQSLLSLHGAAELSEGIGLDSLQETQALPSELASAFPNSISVPLESCLSRYLSSNRAQTIRSDIQSSIPSSDGSKSPRLKSALLFIHCLSEREAISCVAALLSLTRIAAQPGTQITGFSADQMRLSEVFLPSILPLCRHVVTTIHAKHVKHSMVDKMDQVGLEEDKEKEYVIAREKKLIRKMKSIISWHIDALGSERPLHN